MQLESEIASPLDVRSLSPCYAVTCDPTVSLAKFVEEKFIPNHVERKSLAGRTHYQAILKHVLRPETVNRLFTSSVGIEKARLKSLPDWPYLDEVRLCDLTPDHVRNLTTSASTRGYSPQTVKHIRSVMSAVISHAKRERMFDGGNPVVEVALPLIPRKTPRDLTIVETKTILGLMQYPEREMALVTITTGMSITQICALQWKHINLTACAVNAEGKQIPPRSIIVKNQWNAGEVADGRADRDRYVVVPEPLIGALMRLRRRRRIADPNGFVIATREGSPIRPESIRIQRLKPIGRRLEMPWLSWQVLKRAHEVLLLELRVQLTADLIKSFRAPQTGSAPGATRTGSSSN